MSLLKLNPIEPPWYGPVCPVVWEGWHREVSPYPDLRPEGDINSLRFFAERAAKKWPLRGSLKLG
jgi:hypothetical protein